MTDTVTLPRAVLEQIISTLVTLDGLDTETESVTICVNDEIKALRTAMEQPDTGIPASVLKGWKSVPLELTPGMVGAFADAIAGESLWAEADYEDRKETIAAVGPAYHAMLKAAPHPPALEQPKGDPCIDGSCSCCWAHLDNQDRLPPKLPQGEQEPVVFAVFRKDTGEIDWDADHVFSNEPWGVMYDDEEIRPLYTHPQPPCQPLTEEEIAELMMEAWGCASIAPRHAPAFARAIERAHGIEE